MGAVNNTTSISNDVYRGWKYNYMFRPNPSIIRFTSKGYQRFVTTMWLCKDDEISPSLHNHIVVTNLWSLIPFGCKPDDGRIRPKHVVIFSSSINIVRNTCCVIDCTHIPIIHTHNGDGTFQNYKYNVITSLIFIRNMEINHSNFNVTLM